MEWWQKAVVVPVRRAWVVVAARLRRKKRGGGRAGGGGGALLKLHDDVQTCAYEDVQVMWEMLQRAETEKMSAGDVPPSKGAAPTALVWLAPRRRRHSIDLWPPRC